MRVRPLLGGALVALISASCGEVEIPIAVDDFAERVEDSQHIYLELTDEERACVFRREAAEVDFDLIINGTGELADAERTAAVQITLDCVDDVASWEGWIQLQADDFEQGIGRGVELSADEGECAIVYMLENSRNPARLFAVGDGASDFDVVFESVDRCLTDENLALVYGETVAFEGYGDDPALDLLHDGCAEGDEVSCDVLYLMSSIGTAYEAFAETCGGANDADGDLCTGVQVDGRGIPLHNDSSFAEIRDGCGAGEGIACDLYFLLSEFGSEEEEFGFTCGGLIPLGAVPDCRTVLGDP